MADNQEVVPATPTPAPEQPQLQPGQQQIQVNIDFLTFF